MVLQTTNDTNVHLIDLSSRRAMCAKYKQLYATQSEVTCTDYHLALTPTSSLPSNHEHHHHRVTSPRSRDCMASLQNGSCVRESVTHALICLHSARTDINTRRFACRRNFGSCSLCSSSVSRRILVVVVREQMHITNIAFTLT